MVQIKDKHKRMKKDWVVFKGLLNETGSGWDSQTGTFFVDDEKKNAMMHNKMYKKFSKKGVDRYDEMCEMWSGGNGSCGYTSPRNDIQWDGEGNGSGGYTSPRNDIQWDGDTWSIQYCVDDVMGFDGISMEKKLNAKMEFEQRKTRQFYMIFGEDARKLWVEKNY